jgi:hypothetical protein
MTESVHDSVEKAVLLICCVMQGVWRALLEVSASAATDEQRVAGEDHSTCGGGVVADAATSVARRGKHLQFQAADGDDVTWLVQNVGFGSRRFGNSRPDGCLALLINVSHR